MMYQYYFSLGFSPNQTQWGRVKNHNEIFNYIQHFIKNLLHVDCRQDCFVMYNNKVIIFKREVIYPISDSMIPVDCCEKMHPSLISQLMTWYPSFLREKTNHLYLTEIMKTDWLHMLDDYWNEKDTPYSDEYDFWSDWLYQYFI